MQIKVYSDTTIYIVAPSGVATGGPELLHQLAYNLKQHLGINAVMYYLPTGKANPVHKEYEKYSVDYVDTIEDDKKNIIIFPEAKHDLLESFNHIRTVVWWLSVDNYFFYLSPIKSKINRLIYHLNSNKYLFFDKNILKADYHFVQSKYASEFLHSKNIDNTIYLSDYLNKSFLTIQTDIADKQDIVAYNPRKGYRFTKKLIDSSPEISFVPIVNMSKEQVIELLQKAKVYIDFGNHPGKDRIPREAAMLKCCVITGKRGSAKYFEDVSIPEEYKFKDKSQNIGNITKKIKECFRSYEEHLKNFEKYREKISNEEDEFINDLKKIFILEKKN